MQISLRLGAILSIVFAGICLWFAIDGFGSLAGIADPVEAAGARELAWFWSFLAVVGAAIGLVSWKIGQARSEDEEA
jgi:hypothetical protein